MIIAAISFDSATLDWYRSHEDRESFANWDDLKKRLLIRFRSMREGSICGRFLAINQETMVEYQNLFDKLVTSLSFLQEVVLEET